MPPLISNSSDASRYPVPYSVVAALFGALWGVKGEIQYIVVVVGGMSTLLAGGVGVGVLCSSPPLEITNPAQLLTLQCTVSSLDI